MLKSKFIQTNSIFSSFIDSACIVDYGYMSEADKQLILFKIK